MHRSSMLAVCAAAAFVASWMPHVARAQTDTVRAARDSAAPQARVRLRVVGVFDEETGDPIEGADVTDILTGLTSRTTKTGTVALFFTDTTGTLVTVRKVGYKQSLIAVSTSAADTTPVTTTLLRAGHVLATVLVIGDRALRLGKADTISTLLRNGFYERRETGAAPYAAFIPGDKLRNVTTLTDARFYGRPLCEANLYIDGVHIAVPQRTGAFLSEGVDQLVMPWEVAGIETYLSGEMPSSSAHTGVGDATMAGAGAGDLVTNAAGTMAAAGCVSFIWLNR